jgi:hypothetical protein
VLTIRAERPRLGPFSLPLPNPSFPVIGFRTGALRGGASATGCPSLLSASVDVASPLLTAGMLLCQFRAVVQHLRRMPHHE